MELCKKTFKKLATVIVEGKTDQPLNDEFNALKSCQNKKLDFWIEQLKQRTEKYDQPSSFKQFGYILDGFFEQYLSRKELTSIYYNHSKNWPWSFFYGSVLHMGPNIYVYSRR